MEIYDPYSNHNGGNLMFGWDGYLYVSLGDGGSGGDPQNRAQNVDSLLGKILRLDVNNPNPPYYSSPPTNMFYGATAGRDEIYDMGLRNPWRCSIDRMTGDKWIGDVGQNLWEEIDYESRCDSTGHNYGWRCYEGNVAYNTSGCQPQSSYKAPLFVYSHNVNGNCSVTGGYVYRGAQEGGLFGKYLFADYCSGIIWKTTPNGSGGWTTAQLTQTNTLNTNSYTSFGEDIYGELYIARDGVSGSIAVSATLHALPLHILMLPIPL
jgi:glucose/arabinose dehydrogenase